MDETERVEFNKRRAEGRDKSERPRKTLQLKARELNPANTISYAQVYWFWLSGFYLFGTVWYLGKKNQKKVKIS
jgi:hypothetical protein